MKNHVDIDITPDKSLIQKLGLVGYRTEQAIAELIDNSIDARIPDSKEGINVRLDFKERWIGVDDDGHGMNKEDLANAMTVARGTKLDGQLGKFGIGMKSACSALGRNFTIKTSKIDSDKEYTAEYDERIWLSDESQDWKNFRIAEKTLTEEEDWHGTRITISKLLVPLYPNQVSKFKVNFGIRYCPYLESDQISIRINTVLCKPKKPDIVPKSRTDIRITLPFGNMITGYVALLKTRSIKGNYGFHLFKNGRLIKPFEKFGFAAHPENSRIIGELNLDNVPVNFNKSEFIEESPEYAEVRDALRASDEFKRILRSSKSKNKNIATVKSVFDYFDKQSPAQYLERNIRARASKELFDNTTPYEMRMGGKSMVIDMKPLQDEPLYAVKKEGSRITVTINRDSQTFGFVKNPLFLIGMIASEARLLCEDPDFEELLKKRNHETGRFLAEWSERPEKVPDIREWEVEIPNIRNYKLNDELVDLHDFLKENYQFKFQFTALSTLTPYMHTLRGKLVYTLYTTPGNGEHVVHVLGQEFGEEFAIVDRPDHGQLYMLLDMPNVSRIVAVREYSFIKGSSIATPTKAFVDLMVETYTNDIPLDGTELRRMFESMKRYGLIDFDELIRYGKSVKKSPRIEKLLEVAE